MIHGYSAVLINFTNVLGLEKGNVMKDSMLEMMVLFSEGVEPIETAITLIVDGFLISGFVVSKAKYMQHCSFTVALVDAEKKIISEQPDESLEQKNNDTRNFIHLRDAKYYGVGQTPFPSQGSVYCRISLESISGFHIGVFETSKSV